MGYDIITIRALAAELDRRLAGRTITRAVTDPDPHAGALVFCTQGSGHATLRPGRDGGLWWQRDAWPGGLALGTGPERYLIDARVTSVSAAPRDRVVFLRLERRGPSGATQGQLAVEVFPSGTRAALLRERSGEVLASWGPGGGGRGGRMVIGRPYVPPPARHLLLPGVDELQCFLERAREAGGPLIPWLSRSLEGTDVSLAAELAFRANLPGSTTMEDLDPDRLAVLWAVAQKVFGAPIEPGGYAWEGERAEDFSAVAPTRLGGSLQRLDTLSEALLLTRCRRRARTRQDGEWGRLRSAATTAERALQRRLEALRQEISEAGTAEDCERQGSALLAQLQDIPPGARRVDLPDVFDPGGGRRLQIELEPGRSAAESASRLLKRAAKLRRRRLIVPARMAQCESLLGALQQQIAGLESGNAETIAAWLMENGLMRPDAGAPVRRRRQEAHPRRYRTSTGWSVWAGRNNRENDVLTHRLAAQNDLWFHAHGYAGSHVVLRREGHRDEPDAATIGEAASVAAYWSKGRTARKVAVVYTQAKFVTRPRGAAPGQALLRRERTIVVQPGLLAEEEPGILQ